MPKTAYYLDGSPEEGVDFTPGAGTTTIISSAELALLNDTTATLLSDRLGQHALVEVQTADGRWVRDIYLPEGAALEGKMVRASSNAGYNSTVRYSGRQVTLSRGQMLQFKFVNGQWIRDGELENNGIRYATDAWSAVLPADWIQPGLSLQLSQGTQSGELVDLQVGAPSELLIHTIDIGMLTTPRNQFAFARESEAHREYFQTVPTSRLIVSQYAPLSLPEVMLPNGTLLTDFDPSEGGWHTGTMRQRIGKELISHGIDNANYGINSTAGEGESSHPYVVAQLAAHNSRGKYANGIQVHGGSGGGGDRHARQLPWQRIQPRGGPQLWSRSLRRRLPGIRTPQRGGGQFELGLGWGSQSLHSQLRRQPQRSECLSRRPVPGTFRGPPVRF